MRQKVFLGSTQIRSKCLYGGMEWQSSKIMSVVQQHDPMAPVGYDERIQYSSGGKVSANIHEMERACNQMAGYNRSLTKNRQ